MDVNRSILRSPWFLALSLAVCGLAFLAISTWMAHPYSDVEAEEMNRRIKIIRKLDENSMRYKSRWEMWDLLGIERDLSEVKDEVFTSWIERYCLSASYELLMHGYCGVYFNMVVVPVGEDWPGEWYWRDP